MICGICGEQEHKYKCPKCRIPYCSVSCYQLHSSSEGECISATTNEKDASKINHAEKTNKLSTDQMQQILHNDKLKQLLRKHQHTLLPLLQKINASDSVNEQRQLYQEAMECHSSFPLFVQHILSLTEPQTND
jgi:hypothetical protein